MPNMAKEECFSIRLDNTFYAEVVVIVKLFGTRLKRAYAAVGQRVAIHVGR